MKKDVETTEHKTLTKQGYCVRCGRMTSWRIYCKPYHNVGDSRWVLYRKECGGCGDSSDMVSKE